MQGIRYSLETAIRFDKKADLFRRIAEDSIKEELKKIDSKVDKLNYVHEVFEGFETGKYVSLSYNLRQEIERGEI